MYGKGDFSPYEVEYAGRSVKVNKCPYDLCHLIDGRNERGETINEVDQLCETVGNALFLGMSSMAYRINSVTDNLLQHINVGSPKLWNGRYARYSSIGVGSIYYPARELHRCVSANSGHVRNAGHSINDSRKLRKGQAHAKWKGVNEILESQI